ncbi:hypothetical protein BT69DRAFT_1348414 [Atractiella rhizophila]|nr:hypothetical protein BT69DRAFT_1348414 [Atractiella rhizophila]
MSGVFLTYTERDYPMGALPLTRASICINRQVSNTTVERWHLVAYYNREYRALPRVSNDPALKSVIVPFKMYVNNSSRNRSGTGGLFGGSSTSSKSPPNALSVRAATPPPRPSTAMFAPRPTEAQPDPLPSYAQSQAQQQPRPTLFARSGLPSSSTNTANARLPPMQTRPPTQPQTQPSRGLFGGTRASTPPPQATRPPAQPPPSGSLFGRRAPSPGPQMQQQPQQARGMFGMRAPSPQPTQSQPLRSVSPNSASRSFWGRSSNPSPTSRTSSEYNHSHYQPDDMMEGDREMGGLGIGIQRPTTGMGIGRPRLPSVTRMMSGMNGLGSYQRGRRMSVDMRGPDDTEHPSRTPQAGAGGQTNVVGASKKKRGKSKKSEEDPGALPPEEVMKLREDVEKLRPLLDKQDAITQLVEVKKLAKDNRWNAEHWKKMLQNQRPFSAYFGSHHQTTFSCPFEYYQILNPFFSHIFSSSFLLYGQDGNIGGVYGLIVDGVPSILRVGFMSWWAAMKMGLQVRMVYHYALGEQFAAENFHRIELLRNTFSNPSQWEDAMERWKAGNLKVVAIVLANLDLTATNQLSEDDKHVASSIVAKIEADYLLSKRIQMHVFSAVHHRMECHLHGATLWILYALSDASASNGDTSFDGALQEISDQEYLAFMEEHDMAHGKITSHPPSAFLVSTHTSAPPLSTPFHLSTPDQPKFSPNSSWIQNCLPFTISKFVNFDLPHNFLRFLEFPASIAERFLPVDYAANVAALHSTTLSDLDSTARFPPFTSYDAVIPPTASVLTHDHPDIPSISILCYVDSTARVHMSGSMALFNDLQPINRFL